ncbi:MAG: hypothetical protein WAM52_21035 [Steroidobacteraceae bacterium]
MKWPRPNRLQHIAGIGVDRMGAIADAAAEDLLRLENLDVDIPPDAQAVARTQEAASLQDANSYLLAQGVCATSMAGWGEFHGSQYIRFVFSNEPVARLKGLGKRVRAALDSV